MGILSLHWTMVAWSAASGVCGAFAVLNFLIWLRRPRSLANGIFAVMAASTAAMALMELALMHAGHPADYAVVLRWGQPVVFILLVAIVCFVRVYLHAGRLWLGWSVCLLRGLSLVANFTTGENVNFLHIETLRHVPFLGDQVAVAVGARNPWMLLSQLALLLLVVFLFDAGREVWRRGEKQKALITGTALFGFVFLGLLQAVISFWGLADVPVTPSVFFVGVIAVMGLELSRDILRAEALATALREGERRFALAAEAANLGIWTRDPVHGTVWASPHWRRIFGFAEDEPITVNGFLDRVHPEDRSELRQALWKPNRAGNSYELEYRITGPGGGTRWIASRGSFEKGGTGAAALGVSVDVTDRKKAESALQEQRSELAHLSRVAMLGELSGSLAHELNQPLTTILSNAQAAQRFLARPDFDRAEIGDILQDIVEADKRAGDVIRSLRALFRKGEIQLAPLDLHALARETLGLVRSDMLNRHVVADLALTDDNPLVRGDRVQIQQVLLNLILNGVEAMSETGEKQRRLNLHTERTAEGLRVVVQDSGPGVPAELQEKIFEPFFTTKPQGLGLGLVVCRSILDAHQSALRVVSPAGAGAGFSFVLPFEKGDPS